MVGDFLFLATSEDRHRSASEAANLYLGNFKIDLCKLDRNRSNSDIQGSIECKPLYIAVIGSYAILYFMQVWGIRV